ncbi:hypothetical protein [Burkholderia phage FLC9]|nr:hypothetical protein [Burkholderia phage FLC9]
MANAGNSITLAALAAYTANNAYNQTTGNPGTIMLRAGATNCSIGKSTDATIPGYMGWANSTSTAQGLAIALADIPLLQGGVTKAYLGFRTISTTISAPGTTSVFGVAASPTVVPTALLTETQLARVVNVPQYVEVKLDTGLNVYSVWVDGLQVVKDAALATGFTHLIFGSNAVLTNAGNMYVRDFYFLDADSTQPNARLGPIQSAVALQTAVNAPNYTSSDSKTPLQDFQTAYSGAPAATPNITNAASNDPVTVSFQSSVPVGAGILAVQYKMAASVNTAAQMTAQLNNGSATKNLPNYGFADLTMDYGRDLAGVQVADPSGAAWTPAGFAATQLIVQPQSAT